MKPIYNMYMFNNQKETDLQNFKTDESLIVFLKTTTDSAHLRCTGRLFHETAVALSHSLRPNFTVLFLFDTNDR